MTDDKLPRRLHIAREGSRVRPDPGRLERLVAGFERRRKARRARRVAFAGAATATAIVLVVALWYRGPRGPGGEPTTDTTAARTPAQAGTRGGPRLLEAPLPGPASAAGPEAEPPEFVSDERPSPGPLQDVAADRARARELWADYRRAPDSHPGIPNVSYAGHRQGEPTGGRPAAVVNVRVAPFNAAGDGVTDDTEAIRRALQSVEPAGGVVYLPGGEYLVSSVLFVSGSNTILRGESRDRTRLVFTRPLDAVLGTNVDGAYSRWQWMGGLVWFAPRTRQPPLRPGSAGGWNADAWALGPELTRVAAAARRGDRSIEVASSAGLRPGALVFLDLDGEQPQALRRWPVEIAAVAGRRVTLRQPLRFDLTPELAPRLRASREAALVRDSGIERMTLVMRRDRQWDALGVIDQHGWNGVYFQSTVHGFARELAVIDGQQAAGTSSSKNVTLSDITLRSTAPRERQAFPRGISVRASSHDVLVERVDIDPHYWFRLRLEGSGHAISRVRGPLRWIGGPAADTVLTDVTVLNAGRQRVPEPPGGLRVVVWGLGYEGRDSPTPPPEPANLYEAQRQLRR